MSDNDNKLDIAAGAISFGSGLAAIAAEALRNRNASREALIAAVEEHTKSYLLSIADGGAFDQRHDKALSKLDAAIEAERKRQAGAGFGTEP